MIKEHFVIVYHDQASGERAARKIPSATIFFNGFGTGVHFPSAETVLIIPRNDATLPEQGRELFAIVGEALVLFNPAGADDGAIGSYEPWLMVERSLTAAPAASVTPVDAPLTTEEKRMHAMNAKWCAEHGIPVG